MPSAQMSDILRDLERHKHIFDGDVVGEEVLDIAAEEQIRTFTQERDPDGDPLAALSDDYYFWKERHAATTDIGVLEGAMGEDANFVGERTYTPAMAWATFGVTAEAKDHAEWFIEGDPGRNRPPRDFLGLSAEAIGRIDELLERHHENSL